MITTLIFFPWLLLSQPRELEIAAKDGVFSDAATLRTAAWFSLGFQVFSAIAIVLASWYYFIGAINLP